MKIALITGGNSGLGTQARKHYSKKIITYIWRVDQKQKH